MNCAYCIPSFNVYSDRHTIIEQMAGYKKSILLYIKQNTIPIPLITDTENMNSKLIHLKNTHLSAKRNIYIF